MYEGRPNRPPPPRPPPMQAPQVDPNNHLLMHNHNMFYPNPTFQLQNPSFYYQQNPTLPYFFPQNPNFFPQVNNLATQNPNFNNQSSNFNPRQQTSSVNFRPPQNSLQNSVVESGGAAGRTVPTTLTNPPPKTPSVGIQHKKIKTEKSTNAGGGQNEAGKTGSSSKFLVPKAKFSVPNDSVPPHKPNNTQSQRRGNISIDKIEKGVVKARWKLLAAGEHVSAWNVSAAVLKKLKVNSWSSLGCQMQEVPSLNQLMSIEGQINSFINCFVGVRRITSLYDLEVAICKNEGVKQFDELELGPLVRHPLVVHYFALSSEVNTVHKISSEDIISYLWVYMSTGNRKEVVAEQFLDFIAKKRSLAIRDELGVRIESLGLHIGTICEARRLEDGALDKFLEGIFKKKSKKKSKKRPLFSKQKQQLDERFSSISQRMKSFSSVKEDFDGKHIRFDSSSSEENEDNEDAGNQGKLTSQSAKSCDRVSSCPYPSLNEERVRLGLKCEMNSTAGLSFTYDEITSPCRKKRKRESACLESEPSKLAISADDETGNRDLQFSDQEGFSLADSSMGTFITTWKDACCNQTVHEVFDRMLQFYDLTTQQKKRLATRQRKRMKSVFLSYPCIGLLNVAITSIKRGMWDSIYDTLNAGNHGFTELVSSSSPRYESIDVEPSAKNESISDLRQSVSIEDIIRKLTVYFEGDTEISSNDKSHLDRQLILLGKLCRCEVWLAEQFAVKEFKTLGHGDFITFLQKNVSQLPSVFVNNFVGNIHEKSPFRVCILENQLHVILSQALDSSWEDEAITTQKVFLLLMRQFPSISFNIPETGLTEDFFNNLRDQQSSAIAKCVLFSATLSGTYDYGNALARDGTDLYDITGVKTELGPSVGSRGPVSFDDAMKVLLRAPMLSDLHVWSHWDLIFAPSLGPLVGWVLNEVNSKELLCLVTKEGKVVRVNPSATLDSYLEAALQEAPFRTAVELISLFSLYGGKRHLPLSLLKSHTHQAFKVIIKNSRENIGVADAKSNSADRAIPVASRFFLDCLGYLPSEFRNFAADVLLFGLRSIIKDAPSSILCECNDIEQRVLLHDIGLALGIVEWIDDYYIVRSTSTDPLNPSGISCLLPPTSKLTKSSFHGHTTSNKLSSSKSDTQILAEADCHTSSNKIGNDCLQNASEQYEHKDASFIIESIRREEFGLDTNVSETQSSMLKKQHARLGRALHCLSQELYSQDSHFLLELVQNADDNIYHENMEPTLTFILRETGIIVLNNERGFSSHNIRALCDIGNSTKKGSGAGYIGQKGIGFKSVFRVTDAPEIHSNGFHVKFDISEGQIGFVLPTEVPPCSIDLFGEMASENADKSNVNCWNTCIVLPFRKNLLERAAVSSVISLFSDLHPSLLLFLHRLRCIKFRNLLDDSLVVMRKEHVGDGIIKVSHGSEKMTWLAVSRTLQADGIRPDVQTTEIALAFTLGELEDGVYAAHLELQPVFAFLPLRAYGLKFILQGDFVLPSSREEVDGNSPWNQWLLSEFPDLFISAERSFCDLPCFRTNKGKAVSAYMSFVPLTGEVHGFFSCLPRMIISKLRMSNCMLLEDDSDTWVPPCKAIRRWNEKTRILLPNSILRDRLGLGLLNKNIILSDPLARALGIEDYGPKIFLKVLSSLSLEKNGLKSMGIAWLGSWLNELYVLSFHSAGHGSVKTELESDIIDSLRKIPFIPLSDGTYVSVDEGTVWLHSEASSSRFDCEHGPRTFPNLYANLRMVNPDLLVSTGSTMFCEDTSLADNVTRVLHRIGVQRLSEHDIIKLHILPSMSTEMITNRDNSLMTEYLAFVMLHLQSGCLDCRIGKGYLISDLRNKAFISTSYGYKRLVEVPIHFGKEYGNPVKVNKLIDGLDFKWHEVDAAYLTCPSTKSLSSGLTGWRNFFQELGITDFIDVVQREKSITDMSHSLNRLFSDGEIVSLDSIAMDWESDELFKLLSLLSFSGDPKRCRYMLEVLDTFWDSSYGDKTVGFCNSKARGDSKSFKSSFMHSICDVPWVVSSMDDELHYPKDLFHDCDTVRSFLGTSAPYAVPKVKNEKLLGEIGFKTQVTLDDIFSILQVWRRSGTLFHASIAQMSRFYTFVWNELSTSRPKIMSELRSGPYIFVPFARVLKHEDVVPGILLSAEDVYWHDSTGSIEQMKIINPSSESTDVTFGPSPNILSTVYPELHDFFVNECGVDETPPFLSYLQILLQLSSVGLPSNSANAVFQVLLKWADGMKSGLLGSDDIVHLRESLLNKETTILPTVQDKWVSLHVSFGLVCWCDEDNLKKEFNHSDNIDFIYFGELNNDDMELLRGKVSVILKALGIPSISEVVTREAIYDGTQDSSFKASLVNWALPYAQRYIFNIHPLRYGQLKQTEFGNLNNLQVSVVDSLCSRNVIKRCDIASKKRSECNSLLQGNILFTRAESDSHSVFMELSRLFFDGTPELHLANFLHMITTMVESGSNEEQLEFFILNSQNLPKLADKDDSVWALSSTDNNEMLQTNASTISNKEENPSKPKKKRGLTWNWPPANWKTAPDMNFARTNGYRTQATPVSQQNSYTPQEKFEAIDIDANWTIEDASMVPTASYILPHTETLEGPATDSTVDVKLDAVNASSPSDDPEEDSSIFSRRDQVNTGNPNPQQAMLTGRLGETIASKYFKDLMGNAVVKWVNEFNETGLPYDILIEEQGKTREYIEVKATTSARKDWFIISTREWHFAAEKGDSYSIAHVALLPYNKAKITTFRNPVKLCQRGQLQLLVMMPKDQPEFALVER